MKYVLLFYRDREQQGAWEELPDDVREQEYARVGRWFAEHGSKLGAGNQLRSTDTATTVTFQNDGLPLVRDGSFIESNEVIGGYIEIDVADLDEALRLAKTWPANRTVEIRPVATSR